MAKPLITEIHLLEETSDKNHQLTRTYKVSGNKELNVDNVFYAKDTNGLGLPAKGSPNPNQSRRLNPSKITVADTFSASASGSEEGALNIINCTIGWVLPNAVTPHQTTEPENFLYPWDSPANIQTGGSAIGLDMWGVDEWGNPLKYSNGEPVNLQKSYPLLNISISRARKVNDTTNNTTDSMLMAYNFFQRVNTNVVSLVIEGVLHQFGSRKVLVESFDLNLQRFKKTDPITGEVTTIPYWEESIQLVVKSNTWITKIPDEGHFEMALEPNTSKKYIRKFQNTEDGTVITEPQLLNGQGRGLLGFGYDASSLRDIVPGNEYQGETSTPDAGVVIADQLTTELAGGVASNARMVFLAFQTYQEADFAGMDLNRNLTNV